MLRHLLFRYLCAFRSPNSSSIRSSNRCPYFDADFKSSNPSSINDTNQISNILNPDCLSNRHTNNIDTNDCAFRNPN